MVSRSFNENLSGLIKAAVYRSDGHPGNPTTDETVLWVRMNIRF